MSTTNQEKAHIVSSFDGAMQRRSSRFQVKQNQLIFSKNADYQRIIGAISKSLGYDDFGNQINSGSDNNGSGSLNTSAGVNKLVAFSGTDAYVYNSGTSAWDAQGISYTTGADVNTERFLDMLFAVFQLADAPRSYTGAAWSTTTNVTDMPKSKYIKEHNSRLYLFNINIPVGGNFPSRVWYSDLPTNNAITWGFESGTDLSQTASSAVITSAGSVFITRNIKVGDPIFITTGTNAGEYEVKSVDSETQLTLTKALTNTQASSSFWVGGNWFDVARDNSDVGAGLSKNSDRLLCFKRYSLHKFQKGTDAFTDNLVEVKGVPGTVSHRSIVNFRDWTFYWADDGMYRYDGTTSVLLTGGIQDIVDGLNPDEFNNISGWVDNNRVIKMFVGNVTNNDTNLVMTEAVVCFDALSETVWLETTNTLPRSTTTFIDGNIKKTFFFSNDGYCLQTQTGNEHFGVPINMEVETPFYFPIVPEVEMNFTRFKIYTQHGRGISVRYKFAYVDGKIDQDWKELDLVKISEDEQEWRPKETEGRAAGYALKFQESSTSNARPVIERIAAFYIPGGLR